MVTILLALNHRQQVGKTYNGIERRTDFVTHVCQEGGLQAVALLGLVTGSNQVGLHLLLRIDTHRGSYDTGRIAIHIAGSNGTITLLPIVQGTLTQFYTIHLVIRRRGTGTDFIDGHPHTLGIGPIDDIGEIFDREFGRTHQATFVITEIGIYIKHLGRHIDMPRTELHGLEHKLGLDIVLAHLFELDQLGLELTTSATLNKNHDEQPQEQQRTAQPKGRNEVRTFRLRV